MSTYYDKALTSLTISTDIVPASDFPSGQKFYCTSISITGVNTSSSAMGVIEILDNGDSGTLKDSIIIPAMAVGGSGMSGTRQIPFHLPIQFSSNVRARLISGNVTYGVAVSGYFDN